MIQRSDATNGEVIAKIDKALQHVHDLCQGKEKWTMRVPADVERDSDLIPIANRLRAEAMTNNAKYEGAIAACAHFAADAARWRFISTRINYRDERRGIATNRTAPIAYYDVRVWRHETKDLVSDSITVAVDQAMKENAHA